MALPHQSAQALETGRLVDQLRRPVRQAFQPDPSPPSLIGRLESRQLVEQHNRPGLPTTNCHLKASQLAKRRIVDQHQPSGSSNWLRPCRPSRSSNRPTPPPPMQRPYNILGHFTSTTFFINHAAPTPSVVQQKPTKRNAHQGRCTEHCCTEPSGAVRAATNGSGPAPIERQLAPAGGPAALAPAAALPPRTSGFPA